MFRLYKNLLQTQDNSLDPTVSSKRHQQIKIIWKSQSICILIYRIMYTTYFYSRIAAISLISILSVPRIIMELCKSSMPLPGAIKIMWIDGLKFADFPYSFVYHLNFSSDLIGSSSSSRIENTFVPASRARNYLLISQSQVPAPIFLLTYN